VRNLLQSELLPHVRLGGEEAAPGVLDARRALMMAAMVRRLLLTSQGRLPLDDRDA
jgi:hypothetical protein